MSPVGSPSLARVAVVGTSGAGKTTFAARLAAALGSAHIELDALHWLPEWQERPDEDFRRLVVEAVAAGAWVADGNYAQARDLIWPRATSIVWLNYAFPIVFGRVAWRTCRRVVRRERLFAGNRESLFRALATRDSILWWTITTFAARRREFRALSQAGSLTGAAWLEFRRPAEADSLLARLAHPAIGDARPDHCASLPP
jgi:adenylate kinase family enzyme